MPSFLVILIVTEYLELQHFLPQLLFDIGDVARNYGFHDGFAVEVLLHLLDMLLGFSELCEEGAHCIDELLHRCIINLIKAELQTLDDGLMLIVQALIGALTGRCLTLNVFHGV